MNIELSKRQADTIASALTVLSAAILLFGLFGIFYLIARFVALFSSVFLPLFVALILALLLRPAYELFYDRLHASRVGSVTLVFLSVLLPVGLLLWLFGAFAVSQISELIGRLPEAAERVRMEIESNWPQVKELWDRYGLTERAQAFVNEQAGAIWETVRGMMSSAASAGASAFRSVAAGLSWFVLPVYLAFFLMAPPLPRDLGKNLPFLKQETRNDVVYLVAEFIKIVVTFFRGQLIIAVAQGLLFALGFLAVGLQYGFLIGLMLGLLNIIPYLGSMIGLAVVLPLAFFQPDGGPVTLASVIFVFVVVQLIEGYYLTPKVMGERTGLHPLAILVGLFFWGTAFDGVAGMILAVPLTAFFVVFWRLVRTKYISEIV